MSGNRSKTLSMRIKLLIAGLVTVCAALGIVAFVAVSSSNTMESSQTLSKMEAPEALKQKRSAELMESQELEAEESDSVQRFARQTFSTNDGDRNDEDKECSCFTEVSNNTVPGAHIVGVGKFDRNDGKGNPLINGHKQLWRCAEIHQDKKNHHHPNRPITAFVDGGIGYDQSEQKLTIPLCGYYQINSQILFWYKPGDITKSETIHHVLKYSRNCEGWPEHGEIALMARNTIEPGTKVTTHTSDIVKLCNGAKVWIEIPENPINYQLVPEGDRFATFLSVAMVSKTSCHWPPEVKMSNTDHSHDNDDNAE